MLTNIECAVNYISKEWDIARPKEEVILKDV